MARPKSIPWRERVSIFVDYRRSGKIQPTAKTHDVARSTVTAIVNEFVDDGFSRKPRPDLPDEMLREMQKRHLESLIERLKGSDDETPFGCEVGRLNLGPTGDDEDERQRVENAPVYISEEATWHLKDTEAEQMLTVAQTAVLDEVKRRREVWRDLQQELENACELPEMLQLPEVRDMESEPRILRSLKEYLVRSFTEPDFKRQPPSHEWLDWSVQEGVPSLLMLRNQLVAVGSADDLNKVMKGVERFIDEKYRDYQRRFIELDHLRRDLFLMDQITSKKRAEINPDDIRQSICPACPHPESSVGSEESQATPRISENEAE